MRRLGRVLRVPHLGTYDQVAGSVQRDLFPTAWGLSVATTFDALLNSYRYQVTTHKDSQIVNDPNDYCYEVGNPRLTLDLIKRIVTVSLETNRIVASLPALEVVE